MQKFFKKSCLFVKTSHVFLMADTNVLARFIGSQFFTIKTCHPFKNNVTCKTQG